MSATSVPVAICDVCGKKFGRFFKRHPQCERITFLRRLDEEGQVSLVKQTYLSQAGWRSVDSAPGMRTVNGIGTILYGRRDEHGPSTTVTATLFAVLLFVPLFPIRTYRVVAMPGRHHFFLAERAPERRDWALVGRVWICVLAVFGAWRLIFG